MGHAKSLMRPIYLRTTRTFSSRLAVNKLLPITKMKWLMLFYRKYLC